MERNACWPHFVSFRLDFLKKALGDVGGCDGTDTRQGDYETSVSLDADDMSLGTGKQSAGHPHPLSALEDTWIIVEIFQAIGTRRHHQPEHIHLTLRDGRGYPPLQSLMCIDHRLAANHLLHTPGLKGRRVEKHKRRDCHLTFLAVFLLGTYLVEIGNIALHILLTKYLLHIRDLVEIHLEGIPAQSCTAVIVHFWILIRRNTIYTPSCRAVVPLHETHQACPYNLPPRNSAGT